MVKIYYRKIKDGKMTIDDVPERWRDAVKAMLYDEVNNNG